MDQTEWRNLLAILAVSVGVLWAAVVLGLAILIVRMIGGL